MDVVKTYKGKTAGGWLKHAKVSRMQAGTHGITIDALPGVVAIMSDARHGESALSLIGYDGLIARLALSARAEEILRALETIADKRCGEER